MMVCPIPVSLDLGLIRAIRLNNAIQKKCRRLEEFATEVGVDVGVGVGIGGVGVGLLVLWLGLGVGWVGSGCWLGLVCWVVWVLVVVVVGGGHPRFPADLSGV